MKEIIIRYPDIDFSNEDFKNKLETDTCGNLHFVEVFVDGAQIKNVKHFSLDVDPVNFNNNTLKIEQYFTPGW